MPDQKPGLKPVSTIVFDVNETLLDITTLEPLFQRVFGDPSVMREWFAELILYSQTMTLSGRYTPFGALAGGVLQMVGANKDVPITDDDVAELKSLIGSMPAHADVAPALRKLRDAGFQLVTLTNSPPSPAPSPLEKAGLADFFERSFSIDDVEKFKPHPATYQMVAETLDLQTDDLCMVACHLWDTIGAQAAGCQGAFLTRPNNNLLEAEGVPQPHFRSDDLVDLSEQIIAGNGS
ncbi:2-haloalkanoic acid dehalogenase [Sulfitobacter indolifex]|uniref:(S)-2-haloacid dehalogenase n=1 Tax=Sulfitobacter indolifex HEL-45 TaxID=391624 RepID=A0ABM9X7U0_9RHOB|nr:haloacid dehalogenase type II [Sulfitobacter indolifex]EDQ05595.1 haloacid dehalogenase, type II [Sulfitobacter indolifex HEL-45]UOA19769.1 2-haloalkanoic acid dehalogenase [Sulfitobacter indolifex]